MERARSYQAALEDMYINDHPHVGRIIHPDYRRDLQTLLSQYYEDILDMKGASGTAKIRELKFRKSIEPPPPPPSSPPPPPPDNSRDDADAGSDVDGRAPFPPPPLRRRGAGAAGP
jgi:hypothetical protein